MSRGRALKRIVLPVAYALVIAGCETHSAVTSGAGPPSAVGTASPRAAIASGWAVNSRYAYTVTLDSKADFDGRGGFEFGLESRLRIVPLATPAQEGGTNLLMQLVEPRLTAKGGPSDRATNGATRDDRTKALEQELAKPWILELASGRVTAGRFAQGLSPECVAILRTIAAWLELPPPAAATSPALVREYDSSGQYEAEYRASGPKVHKEKKRYVSLLVAGEVDSAQRDAMLPVVVSSSADLSMRGDVASDIVSQERLKSALPRNTSITSDTAIHLSLVDVTTNGPPPDVTELAATMKRVPGDSMYGAAPRRDEFDDVRIGDFTVESALAKLVAARRKVPELPPPDAKIGDDPVRDAAALDQMQAFSVLAALGRKQPASLAKIVTLARTSKEPPPRVFFDILTNAGTAAAQEALVAFIRDGKLPLDERRDAAMGLIRVHQPTPATVEALERLMTEPSFEEHGIYGLGTASQHLREMGEVDAARAAAAKLGVLLGQAKNTDTRLFALRGIANSAADELMPKVEPFLDDPDPAVRQAAVQSIARMKASGVDARLATRIEHDEKAIVRRTAVTSSADREATPALVSALTRAAQSDVDAAVRYSAVQIIVQWAKNDPSLMSVVRSVAATENVKETRALAESALAPPATH